VHSTPTRLVFRINKERLLQVLRTAAAHMAEALATSHTVHADKHRGEEPHSTETHATGRWRAEAQER
jgi:hypothetical protein